MEELKYFDQLEHLEIQAPLPSDEVLDIAAEALTNKRRLKSLRLGFICHIWQDWEDDSEFCMHETHDLFTSRQMKFEMGEATSVPDEVFDPFNRALLSCSALTRCCLANEGDEPERLCVPSLYFERSFKRTL